MTFLTGSNWFRLAEYVNEQVAHQMQFAQNALSQNLSSQEQVLITAASVLTADFGFKQAVATSDNSTIESVLKNHGNRINADLMMLLDLEGKLLSSSVSLSISPEALRKSIENLTITGIHAQVLNIGTKVFQVIIVPVKAPRTVAYTLIGFEFNKKVLEKLKELVFLDITLIHQNNIIQTSFDSESVPDKARLIGDHQPPNLLLTADDYYHKPIPFGDSIKVTAVLSVSLQEIHQDFNRLMSYIVIIALLVLIIAFTFSSILSRRITAPLKVLMNLTKRIGQGQLGIPKLSGQLPTELKDLYQGFSMMGNAIEQREKEIKYRAERDLLTGLFNRNKILTIISSQLETSKKLVLISLNIKGFKTLNDTLGMANADLLLQDIAQRITLFAEKLFNNFNLDIYTARINSDEFLLCIPTGTEQKTHHYIELLKSELDQPYWLDELKINLSLFFGVVDSYANNTSAERLVRQATIAVNAAYNEKSTIRFYQIGEDEAYLYKLALIEELKLALEEEQSPLFMNYQPKLNFKTGKVDKLEALIRWVNAKNEFVNPELFVSLAEKSSLIVTLTRWVILNVVQQVGQWNKAGYIFNVSVNLSAQDIQHDSFVEYLLEKVNEYHVPTKQITLELTERDLAENEELVATRLNYLKSLGFEISVDDYGIGQSSLAKLKHLPVDELKIDKCFILKLNESIEDQHIVSSTISLGHKLGLRVVAEGVENLDSLALLKQFNCNYAQGYYLSRPLKAEDLITWYDNYESPY